MAFCTRGPRIFQNLMHVYIHINMKIYVFDELLDPTRIIDCIYSNIIFSDTISEQFSVEKSYTLRVTLGQGSWDGEGRPWTEADAGR